MYSNIKYIKIYIYIYRLIFFIYLVIKRKMFYVLKIKSYIDNIQL